MKLRVGLSIGKITSSLLLLEKANGTSNYHCNEAFKALLEDVRALKEEVIQWRRTTVSTPARHEENQPAPQHTASLIEHVIKKRNFRLHYWELPTPPAGKPAPSEKMSTADNGNGPHFLRSSNSRSSSRYTYRY